MAEVFGIVTGTIGLASMFSVCVDCFDYVELARSFPRDFRTSALTLTCTRLRLTRWGQAVRINDDPRFSSMPDADASVAAGRATLEQILVLFRDASEISSGYTDTISRSPGGATTDGGLDGDVLAVAVLDEKLRDVARRRRRGPRLLVRSVRWALHDKARLDALVEGVTTLVSNLETLFPTSVNATALSELTAEEVDGVTAQEIPLLERAARDANDKKLQHAVAVARAGHNFDGVVVRGQGTRNMNGDMMLDNWDKGAIGLPHTYTNVTVEGGAVSMQGNQYGGQKGFFD